MQNKDWDNRIRKMAAAEQMAVPGTMEEKIEHILQTDRKHYSVRRTVLLVAAGALLVSGTVTASVGAYRQRMESMNHAEMERYYTQLQEANVGADSYNREMTGTEKQRLAELEAAYEEQGLFPQGELTMLKTPEQYKKGVGFYAARSTFFFPEEEMSDEELLELIDFRKKRDYSLQQLNAEKASEETEAERAQGETAEEESASEIQTAQERTAEDQPAWKDAGEDMAAYEGQMGIQCMAAGADGLYLGGYNRIEWVAAGSGAPETFYDGFSEEVQISCLYEAQDGSVYAGARCFTGEEEQPQWQAKIYHFGKDGSLHSSFYVGERKRNIVDGLAEDEDGNLYVHTRMAEEGENAYLRIYDKEGNLRGSMADGAYVSAMVPGIARGRDGRVYVALKEKDSDRNVLAAIEKDTWQPEIICISEKESDDSVEMPWDAIGVTADGDFVLWSYDGIDIYRTGEKKPVRAVEQWQLPCGVEGTRFACLEDGTVVLLAAEGGRMRTLTGGAEIWERDPKQSRFYYVSLP